MLLTTEAGLVEIFLRPYPATTNPLWGRRRRECECRQNVHQHKTHSLTHSLSEAVFLEKLTVALLIKFPTFYGTQRCSTAFTRPRYWTLSLASRTQSKLSQSIHLRPISILSSNINLRLRTCL